MPEALAATGQGRRWKPPHLGAILPELVAMPTTWAGDPGAAARLDAGGTGRDRPGASVEPHHLGAILPELVATATATTWASDPGAAARLDTKGTCQMS